MFKGKGFHNLCVTAEKALLRVLLEVFVSGEKGRFTAKGCNLNQLYSTNVAAPMGHALHPKLGGKQWRAPQGNRVFVPLP